MKPKVEQVDLQNDSTAIANAYADLEAKHPDYAAIGADPAFIAWGEAQPPKVQELLTSFDADEVSLGLALYKAERGLTRPTGQQGNTGTATDDRRARQLEGSRSVTSRGAPAATGVPDDFAAAYKARAESFKRS